MRRYSDKPLASDRNFVIPVTRASALIWRTISPIFDFGVRHRPFPFTPLTFRPLARRQQATRMPSSSHVARPFISRFRELVARARPTPLAPNLSHFALALICPFDEILELITTN